MKALILAAGYATRLYPLTKEYPKPLLKVKDKPIIDYIVEKLDRIARIDEIIVITNSKFISSFRKWKLGSSARKRLTLIDDLTRDEKSRRGAIGDLYFAVNKKRVKDDLLVIGGDNIFDGNLDRFLFFSRSKAGSPVIGAYDIKDIRQAKNYGVIKLDKQSRVLDFKEKPKKPKTALVAMCLYYFPKEKLGLVKEYMKNKKKENDATGLYIDWLRRRVQVFGFVFKGRWYDIGNHRFYHQAKEAF
ncbi:MAG: nucleotidyltransferase family protein [bacterium]